MVEYNFFDNKPVGADDLNRLRRLFVSEGVGYEFAFVDGQTYAPPDLNNIVKEVSYGGVVPETVTAMQVLPAGANVTVKPGVVFFGNGSYLEVTSDETLPCPAGVKRYVYAVSDAQNRNRNLLEASASPPSGDFVLLAEVAADGTVTDKRRYAKAKLPGLQSNVNSPFRGIYSGSVSSVPDTYVEELGLNNYRHIALYDYYPPSGGSSTFLYDFQTGASLTVHSKYTDITLQRTESAATISVARNASYSGTRQYNFLFYIF
jgi:hypothetical protein